MEPETPQDLPIRVDDETFAIRLSRYGDKDDIASLLTAFVTNLLEEAVQLGQMDLPRQECTAIMAEISTLKLDGELAQDDYELATSMLSWVISGMADPCPFPRDRNFDFALSTFKQSVRELACTVNGILRDSEGADPDMRTGDVPERLEDLEQEVIDSDYQIREKAMEALSAIPLAEVYNLLAGRKHFQQFAPRAQPTSEKLSRFLSDKDRRVVSALFDAGKNTDDIADLLGKDKGTIEFQIEQSVGHSGGPSGTKHRPSKRKRKRRRTRSPSSSK